MTDKQPEPEIAREAIAGDEDVEGHGMLPMDPSSARHVANAREAEIRRTLYRNGLDSEARRPHKRER